MVCLNNLIKIAPSCDGRVDGELYLSDLPFISQDKINAANDSARITGVQLLENILNSSYQKLRSDIIGEIGNSFMLVNNNGSGATATQHLPMDAVPYVQQYAVIQAKDCYDIQLESIRLLADNDTQVDVEVFDAYTGEILYTKNAVDVKRNQFVNITLPLRVKAQGSGRKIGIEVSGFNGANAYRLNCPTSYRRGSHIYDLSHQEQGTGFIVNYSMICNYDDIFCSYASSFAMAYYYLCAANICDAIAYSTRINGITTGAAKDDAVVKMREYTEAYKEELVKNIATLNIRESECIRCRKLVRNVVKIP